MARATIAAGALVRLIGAGVTLPRVWPSWVTETPGLWLTDLTAYRTKTRWDATQALRESLKTLADDVFAGTFPDLRGSEVFYPHIGSRAFAGLAFVMPIAVGLAAHHARDDVRCTRPDWPGFALYGALAGLRRPRASHLGWVGRVVAFASAGWAASSVHVVRTYLQSRIGLSELRRRPSHGTPRVWVHLFADWPRTNVALIEGTRGRRLGVLLHGNIGPGERHEADLSTRRGRELWPGLRLLDAPQVDVWDTTSTPESLGQFSRTYAQFAKGFAMATIRLSRRGPLLQVGSYHLDMTAHARDLAKLLTIDMARACMADAATGNAIRKHDFRDTTVLFSGAQASDVAVVVRRLRHAGATTIDFAHGWSGEAIPFVTDPPAAYRCVWARTDEGDGDVRFIVGGFPVPPRLPRPNGSSKVRVLLMSNYVHRDDMVYQTGLDSYQDEVLEVIRRRCHQYAFRWRPHPADRPELVARAADGLPAELSRERPLAEDLAWADVVVSTLSTALLEALLLDLPIVIHVTPDLEGTPFVSPFSPARTFFLAEEGVEKLDAVVRALGAPDLLAPERRARSILFGATQTPATLVDALSALVPATPSDSHPQLT